MTTQITKEYTLGTTAVTEVYEVTAEDLKSLNKVIMLQNVAESACEDTGADDYVRDTLAGMYYDILKETKLVSVKEEKK